MGAFGEKLRKQREQRGLELEAISNTTKISPRMLRALEDEHFDQLPGGVFNKGFVRAYARHVGLDEEEAIADYLAALRESQVQQQAILPDFRSPAGAGRKDAAPEVVPLRERTGQNKNTLHDPRPEDLAGRMDRPEKVVPPLRSNASVLNGRLTNEARESYERGETPQLVPPRADAGDENSGNTEPEIFPTQGFITGPASGPQVGDSRSIPWKQFVAALFVIIVLFGFWKLHRHPEAKIAAQLQQPSSQQTSSSTVSSTLVPASQTSSPAAASAPGPPAQTSTPVNASPTTSPTPAPIVSSFAAKPAPSAKPAVAAASSPILTTSLTPAAKPKPHVPTVKPPATFTLLIRAEKTSCVSIVADGKPIAEETLIAPAHTSVRATHEIYVRAGNAAGVSFALNGKEVPASGADGEVKAYIFDASGWHLAPAQPAPPPTR